MKKTVLENLKPVIFIVIVLVLTAISAYPQRRLAGRVVEIIDGKTCVVELYSRRLTAVLQFIETPDPEQPLYDETKAHLQALVLNKNVEFIPRGVVADRTIGRMFVKDVDVSQQMLRDGAAWYSVAERTSQDGDDSLVYLNNEAQAKSEKRGVWGIVDLIPVWEFRAAKEASRRRLEKDEFMRGSRIRQQDQERGNRMFPKPTKNAASVELWANVGVGGQYNQSYGTGSLRIGSDPVSKVGFIFTPDIYLNLPGNAFLRKAEARIYYGSGNGAENAGRSVYLIGVLTASKDYKFMQKNSLTITADKQKFLLGTPRRYFRQNVASVEELMFYKVTREQLVKIMDAKKTSAQIGKYSVVIPGESLASLKELVDATK